MDKGRKKNRILIVLLAFIIMIIIVPRKASGEVAPVTELENKLEGISEEEKVVLVKLFQIQQEIDGIKTEEDIINGEIDKLQSQTKELENQIDKNQKEYDLQLGILKQVMVNYQRGGPTSYLEILLRADNLSEFLKSMNIIKDISHNVNKLLLTLDESKKALEEQSTDLKATTTELGQKKEELATNLDKQEILQKEQEDYLASLKENKVFYQEQLTNIKQIWEDSQSVFTDIVKELNVIISSGYFTLENLNLEYGFATVQGFIEQDNFNQILTEKSTLPKTIFYFKDNQVVIEVPDKHLILTGNFVIDGDSAIRYVVTQGTFYDMPLETASIVELFRLGPLRIDFKAIAGDMIIIDFKIDEVSSTDGKLNFVIKPQF